MNSKRKYSSIVSSLLVFAMFVSVLGLTPLAPANTAYAAAPSRPFPQAVSYPGIIKPNNVTQAAMNASVASYYNSWKSSYLKNNLSSLPGGYYVKGGVTGPTEGYNALGSSEGQGYGMIITVLMAGHDPNAQTIYDGLFKTARAYHSKRNANLMGWIVADAAGAQGHYSSATDGDMDIAYSLILADRQWGSSGTINYLAEAQNMITNGIKASNVTTGNRLNLGDWDSKTALNTRPSDWMLGHMRAFYAVTGDQTWLNVINNLYTVYSDFSSSYSSTTGLISDFVVGNPPQPAPSDYLGEFLETNEYNYNACRMPLRIVMDYAVSGDARGKAIVDKIATWIKGKTSSNPNNVKDGYKLNGTVTGSASYPAAVFAAPFIAAGTASSSNQAWVNTGWSWMINQTDGYYSDSYNLMTMLFMSGNWWNPIAASAPDTQAPTQPTGLTAIAASGTQINLSWTASTDNVGVTGYKILRNGTQVGTATSTTFSDTGLVPQTSYSYTVSAYDAANNQSTASAAASAITLQGSSYVNLALGKTATASSIEGSGFEAAKAVDGNGTTRWASVEGSDTQWFAVDLGAVHSIGKVKLLWEAAYGKTYKIQTSTNGSSWSDAYSTTSGDGGTDEITFAARDARHVRISATKRGTSYGYSLYEFEVWPSGNAPADTTAPTVPGNLAVTGTSSSTVSLSWSASSDNVGVTGYEVYRGSTLAASVAGTSATVSGLTAGTSYSFTVKAKDAAGNVSAASSSISATTLPNSPVGTAPKLINMTFNGDPRTSVAFAWYTNLMTGSVVRVAEAAAVVGNVFPAQGTLTYQGTAETIQTYVTKSDRSSNNKKSFVSHKVIADQLAPGTAYKFQVGNGAADGWGPIGSFTTDHAVNQPFHFIAGSDSQASSESSFMPWADTFTKAINTIGSPKFLINAGDLVDNGDLEEQWQWMLGVAQNSLLQVPIVPVLGGHEVPDYQGDTTTANNNFYNHFNLPRQTIANTHDGSVYSFEYGDALFLVFNSQFEGKLSSNGSATNVDPQFWDQVQWMKNTVARSDKKWKFVTFHKGPYSAGDNSGQYEDSRVKFYKKYLVTAFDEMGIDMVFEAHDHMYMRSYQMYNDQVVPTSSITYDASGNAVNPKGTIYLMSNSLGNKFYEKYPGYNDYFAAINTQPRKKMFTDVSVAQDTLSFVAYTAAEGASVAAYDQYGIKRTDGKPQPVAGATAAVSGNQLTLTWSLPTSGEPVRGFRVYEQTNKLDGATGKAYWSAYIPVEQNRVSYSYTINNVNSAEDYNLVIKAVGVRNNSDPVVLSSQNGNTDTQAPTQPAGLTATAVSGSQIDLSWTASTDDVGVTGYKVYRNGVQVGMAAGTTFSDTGLTPLTGYSYTVSAYDAAGNESAVSDIVGATTLQGSPNTDLALGKSITSSSIEGSGFEAAKAVDGDGTTRWASLEGSDPEWIAVDLGAVHSIGKVKLVWEAAYAKSYKVQLSTDGSAWTDAYSTSSGDGGVDEITFAAMDAQYVRIYGTQRGTPYGYSLYDFEVRAA